MPRHPKISAALILETVGLEVFRDKFGMRDCLNFGIGATRKKLGPIGETPVSFIPKLNEEEYVLTMDEFIEKARDEARHVLASMCGVCPFKRCKMKAWDTAITGSSA